MAPIGSSGAPSHANLGRQRSALFKLSEFDERRFCDADVYHELSEPEQIFHLVWRLEAEVNNGGFEQFFLNSSGEFAPFAAAAFRRIGANATAELIDAALGIIGEDTVWADRDARQDRVNELDEVALDALNDLDQAFYEYPDGGLAEPLYAYLYANRSKMSVPEGFWS